MNRLIRNGLATLALVALAATVRAADGPAVSQAWARATAPGVDVGAVYLTIDGGAQNDELVSASTSRASMVHLHTVEESGGVARMRAIEGIAVPAGKRVVLAPKGMHIMLMGLKQSLVAGQTFTVSLHFTRSGDQAVSVIVRPAGADGPPAQAPR